MIVIINGPNLNLLGRREPEIYGSQSFADFFAELKAEFRDEEIVCFQSNSEGEIIDEIQRYGFDEPCKGIVLNPGGYSHYSVAIADAVAAVPVPVVEVHVSNIHAREDFRATTVTGRSAKGIITGLGLQGYALAVGYLLKGIS